MDKIREKNVWGTDNLCDDLNNQGACRTGVRGSDSKPGIKNLQRMEINKNNKLSEWYSLKQ